MALVDTQGFVMAVDRSLFGPQGRRWIERKLPQVAANVAFIGVSAFGACMLVFHLLALFRVGEGEVGVGSHDVVMQTARRLDVSANLLKADHSAIITPFASKTYNTEFKWADGLSVSRNGGGSYVVYPQENSFLSNRVTLVWGEDPDKHTYECTCKWCLRFLIPCRHVLAVAKDTQTAYRALELVDNGYLLATFRASASDPRHRIIPPVWADLTANPLHLPPVWVKGQAGRPSRGPRRQARIESNGEHNMSSRTYAIYNAGVRAAGGVGIPPNGGARAGRGGAAGNASGAAPHTLDLSQSQGLSQG